MSKDIFNVTRRNILSGLSGSAALLVLGDAFAKAMPTVNDIHYDKDIPVLGNPKGDVTIVEYFDYQCPYCKKGHAKLLSYVNEDGNIRLIMKDWIIFGDASAYASRMVLAAEKSGDYAKAMEAVMATSGRLKIEQVDEAFKKAGLEPKKLRAAYKENSTFINNILQRNMDQAEAFRFQGTPSFVIGTKLFHGVMQGHLLVDAVAEARRG